VELVKGRECGACSVCCHTLPIDTDEFQKLPGVACPHLCAGGGCSIYATRYSVCREYHCGWRYLDFLGEDWRPDKSGVLLNFELEDELPPGYEMGLVFFLVARPPSGLSPPVYDYVARLIAAGIHVMLAVNGPPGHHPAYAHLNETLKQAALARDLGAIEAAFSEALALGSTQRQRFEAIVDFHEPDKA
jgi:hypothetical protein